MELGPSFQKHLGDRKHPDLGTNQCMEKAENQENRKALRRR